MGLRSCAYAVDRKTQLEIIRSFRKVRPSSIFRLLQAPSRETAQIFPEDHRTPGLDIRRSRLAKLLFAIMDESRLQRRNPTLPGPTPTAQYNMIKAAAERFKLAPHVPVSRVLCTDLSYVQTYLDNFDRRVSSAKWATHPRPHAILLCAVRGEEGDELVGFGNVREKVHGPITIFGRPKDRDPKLSTFMVMAVLGRQTEAGAPLILRAYLHPCISASDLMLVDSGYERRTLDLLVREGAREGFEIEKPLHDLGLEQLGDGEDISEQDESELESVGAPPVIKPDFVLRRGNKQPIIVETMGFRSDWYRDRKREIVPQMAKSVGTELIAEHDFHRPTGTSQDERDAKFTEILEKKLCF